MELGHIAEFFIEQRRLGMNKRLNSVREDMGIPANAAYAISGEVARQFNPEYWTKKTQEEDLKNAQACLRRGLLRAEGMEHFDTWREDILRSIR